MKTLLSQLAKLGLLLSVCTFTANLQAAPQDETIDPETIDLNLLKDFPVRFNGRICSLQRVANNYAQWIGGATNFQDGQGESYDALTWYIYSISDHPKAHEIRAVVVEPLAAKQLELPERKDQLYSVGELIKNLETFEAEIQRLDSLPYQSRQPVDHELDRLSWNMQTLNELIQSHQSPWGLDQELVLREFSRLGVYESLSTPRMVIPREPNSGKWLHPFPAALKELARNDAGIETMPASPYSRHLAKLLTSIRDNQPDKFKEHLHRCIEIRGERELSSNAFQFRPPAGWIEQGQSYPFEPARYADAFAPGLGVSKLSSKRDLSNSAMITVNHFPGQMIDAKMLCNSWRIQEGAAPLSAGQFKELVTRKSYAGAPHWVMDIKTPGEVPKKGMRTIAHIIHHSSGTWTISLHGVAQEVEREFDTFQQFVLSVQLPETVSKWIDTKINPAGDDGQSVLGLLRSDRTVDWCVRILGTPEQIEKAKQSVVESLKMLVQKDPADGDAGQGGENVEAITAWRAPREWQAWNNPQLDDAESHHRIFYMQTGENEKDGVVISIMAMENHELEQLVAMTNHLRQSVQQPPLSEEDLLGQLDLDGNDGWVELPVSTID